MTPSHFVIAMLLMSMALTGVWPLIVDEAQNSAQLSLRGQAAVAWNIREYVIIFLAGLAGTWLYSNLGRPMMFATTAVLLISAIAATFRTPMTRRLEYVTPRPSFMSDPSVNLKETGRCVENRADETTL